MIGIILAIALQQQTVAITTSPDAPAVIMQRADAEAQFKQLCASGANDQLLKALAAELNPMPDWAQFVMNGDASVCNRSPKVITPVPLKN